MFWSAKTTFAVDKLIHCFLLPPRSQQNMKRRAVPVQLTLDASENTSQCSATFTADHPIRHPLKMKFHMHLNLTSALW
jgi:hypothetical protein